MATLYSVINTIREANRPMSMEQLAYELKIDRTALEGMIDFWLKKGRLREVGPTAGTICEVTGCSTCSVSGPMSCPMVVHDPKRYEIVIQPDRET